MSIARLPPILSKRSLFFDSLGRYVEQNPAHASLLGYSDSELLGLKTTFLFGEDVFAAIAQELINSGR